MNPATLHNATSLVVTDAQCGFSELCPDELPVPGAVELVPAINRLLQMPFARIDATQDWHPPDHRSFRGQADDFYPPHCVAGTPGADFLPGLHTDRFGVVWRKGTQPDFEAYAVTAEHPAFAAFLRASGVSTVVLCGLAANICVHFTGRDLLRAGLAVVVATDATAGIDVPSAGLFQADARAEGERLGFRYWTVDEVEQAFARWGPSGGPP